MKYENDCRCAFNFFLSGSLFSRVPENEKVLYKQMNFKWYADKSYKNSIRVVSFDFRLSKI